MILTVIIQDESSFIHLQEPCCFRSVHIELTDEQQVKLKLRHKEEVVGQCFLERKEIEG